MAREQGLKCHPLHLFWVKSSIPETDIKIYGERPLPEEVRSSIVKTMGGWPRVNVSFVGDEIQIYLMPRMKAPISNEIFRAGYKFHPYTGRKLVPVR